MLAAGYSPVYPAHVPLKNLRTTTMGTGPFKLKEYKRDRILSVRRNNDYFVKGRPYLDGVDYIVIKSKGTRIAAMQSGQLEISQATETDQKVYDILKKIPEMAFNKSYVASNVNIVFNTKTLPFNNVRLRQAVNHAIHRRDYTSKIQPGYQVGGFMLGPPSGVWGLTSDQVAALPGYGDRATEREKGRQVMRELGYSENKRLKITLTTRSTANYRDAASWAIGELKHIFIDAEMRIVEAGRWYGVVTRREFTIAMNATGLGVDDPDNNYFENYGCGSPRNYSDYCDDEAEKMYLAQSVTIDAQKRLALVHEIEKKLVTEVARVSLGFRVNYYARRAYVKNFVGHQTNHGSIRMQEVWLDK